MAEPSIELVCSSWVSSGTEVGFALDGPFAVGPLAFHRVLTCHPDASARRRQSEVAQELLLEPKEQPDLMSGPWCGPHCLSLHPA